MRKGYAETPWGQVHYRAAGEAGPVLVMLHQTPLSSQQFDACLPLLARHCRVFALDTPGYGMSDAPPNRIGIADYAARFHAAIRSLTHGPFALCGVLTGAVIALDIAHRHPADVSHTILAGVPLMSNTELRAMGANALNVPPLRDDGSHLQEIWAGRQRSWGGDLDTLIVHDASVEIARNFVRFQWGLLAAAACDVAPYLDGLRCPALFLSGERDKVAHFTAAAAKRVRDARHAVIAGAREPLFLTAAPAFAREISAFLAGDAATH